MKTISQENLTALRNSGAKVRRKLVPKKKAKESDTKPKTKPSNETKPANEMMEMAVIMQSTVDVISKIITKMGIPETVIEPVSEPAPEPVPVPVTLTSAIQNNESPSKKTPKSITVTRDSKGLIKAAYVRHDAGGLISATSKSDNYLFVRDNLGLVSIIESEGKQINITRNSKGRITGANISR